LFNLKLELDLKIKMSNWINDPEKKSLIPNIFLKSKKKLNTQQSAGEITSSNMDKVWE